MIELKSSADGISMLVDMDVTDAELLRVNGALLKCGLALVRTASCERCKGGGAVTLSNAWDDKTGDCRQCEGTGHAHTRIVDPAKPWRIPL